MIVACQWNRSSGEEGPARHDSVSRELPNQAVRGRYNNRPIPALQEVGGSFCRSLSSCEVQVGKGATSKPFQDSLRLLTGSGVPAESHLLNTFGRHQQLKSPVKPLVGPGRALTAFQKQIRLSPKPSSRLQKRSCEPSQNWGSTEAARQNLLLRTATLDADGAKNGPDCRTMVRLKNCFAQGLWRIAVMPR